jgi:hypothetical protein
MLSTVLVGCGSSSSSNTQKDEVAIPSTLTLKWSVDTNSSESAIYHKETDSIYVSNIVNFYNGNDGYISKVSKDGSENNTTWFTGLGDPKGMAIKGNSLFVTDVNTIVEINLLTATEVARYNAPAGLTFLNDITYDSSNDQFFISHQSSTDSNHTIYKMTPSGTYSLYYDEDGNGTTHEQNGVYVDGSELVFQGIIGQLKSKNITNNTIKTISSSMDNLQIDGLSGYEGIGYFVSGGISGGSQNKIYFIGDDGVAKALDKGDTTSIHDIDYSKDLKLLLVPSLSSNYLRAYEVK